MKKILIRIWNDSFDIYIKTKHSLYLFCDIIYSKLISAPQIKTIEDTIEYIKINKCSVSRFGDGEIKIALGKDLAFQEDSLRLRNMMREVLSSSIKNHIVCLPDIFNSQSQFEEEAQKHWKLHLALYRRDWYRFINKDQIYYNAFVSRCYMMFRDKTRTEIYFEKLKEIWVNKEILLVEGEKSRLGVGNDLFDNVASLKRILAPNCNAFKYYDNIISEIIKYDSNKYLILIALGPTATILAYDLSKRGYQAIDIGHIDIEYEWYKMRALKKVPVKNKFVNEAGGGKNIGELNNKKYHNQIICHI